MSGVTIKLVPVVFTILLIQGCLSSLCVAQTQTAPTVTMQPLNPSNVTVQPTHANQVLYVKTQLIVDKPPVGKMDFQIVANCDDGWATTVEPTFASFTMSGVRFINATVSVPYDAKASSINSMQIVATSMYMGTHYDARQSAQIHIAMHLEVIVKTEPFKSDHNPQIFKLDLTNYSNLNLSYHVQIMGQDSLLKHGIHVQLDKEESKLLAPYDNETFSLTVGHDTWSSDGQYSIDIKIIFVSPNGDELKVESTVFILVIDQIEKNIPSLITLGVVITMIAVVATYVVHRVNKKRKKDRRSKNKAPTKSKNPVKVQRSSK
jgi:hypothetical protein